MLKIARKALFMRLNQFLNLAEKDIRIFYNCKIIHYSDTDFDIIRYNDYINRLDDNYTEVETNHKTMLLEDIDYTINEDLCHEVSTNEIHINNLHRSCSKIHLIARSNRESWKSFITLTFKENVKDLKKANKEFQKYRRKVKKNFPEFKYLCVPEFQQRGAVHYHILSNLECNSQLIPKRRKKKTYNEEKQRYYDLHYYNLTFWEKGYSTAFDIINEVDSNFKLEKYITKYLYKDFDNRFFGHNKFFYSQNCNLPKTTYLDLDDETYQALLLQYSNIEHEVKEYKAERAYAKSFTINKYTIM